MASARIDFNPATKLGSLLSRTLGPLATARKEITLLAAILDKYIDDEAAIAADAGIAVADVPLVRNLVTQAKDELAGLATTAIAQGSPTGCRQLTDAMALS